MATSSLVGMSVDEAFQAIGTGRYNISMYLILCLNFMYVPMHIFGDLFNTRVPPHHCKNPEAHRHSTESSESSEHHEFDDDGSNYVIPPKSDMSNTYGYFYKDRTCHLTVIDNIRGNKTIECKFGHVFDTSYTGKTVVSEWGLVCEKNNEVIFITIHGVAAVLGAVIFAPFSDKYGRKALLLMCWSQMALMSLGMYFVGDMSSYLVLRFLQRLYVEGAEQAIFIMACEMLPTDLRPNAVSGLYVFYGIGYLVLAFQAYLSTNWSILPESPYWLVFMGREKSAEKFFREAANRNKSELPANFKLKREVLEDDGVAQFGDVKRLQQRHNHHHHLGPGTPSILSDGTTSNNAHNNENEIGSNVISCAGHGTESRHTVHPHVGHFKELFQALSNKMLRREAGIASFVWAVSAFLYYGITVSGFTPGNDAYLNFFLSGVAVIVSSASTTFILRRLVQFLQAERMVKRSRRIMDRGNIGNNVTVLIPMVDRGRGDPRNIMGMIMDIDKNDNYAIAVKYGVKLKYLHKVLKFLAKLFAAAIVSSTQLIVAELFPTTVRSTCVGLVAFFGLLGAGVGMYFSILERVSSKGSTICAGILTLVAGYLCRGLPETSNRPLPGTIVDLMDSYASVMEAIVLMMNKMPGGSDVNISKPRSKQSSRSSSVVSWDEAKRRTSSASMLNLKKKVDNRRLSIPATITNVKKGKEKDAKAVKDALKPLNIVTIKDRRPSPLEGASPLERGSMKEQFGTNVNPIFIEDEEMDTKI
ncbi:Solute carrier family 22 member 7 [Nymphon striatum]|nr:Solute carrier family 22 member 7 [Nymphon striatum]